MVGDTGLPAGVTAGFQPPQITAGQFSILTLTGSNAVTPGASQLTVSASASVQGIAQSSTAAVGLNVAASGNVAFAGRVAVTNDTYNSPIAGQTVLVAQNASADQTFTFQSIPNLKITVYAGTALTLSDGTRPDPFPLSVVE